MLTQATWRRQGAGKTIPHPGKSFTAGAVRPNFKTYIAELGLKELFPSLGQNAGGSSRRGCGAEGKARRGTVDRVAP